LGRRFSSVEKRSGRTSQKQSKALGEKAPTAVYRDLGAAGESAVILDSESQAGIDAARNTTSPNGIIRSNCRRTTITTFSV